MRKALSLVLSITMLLSLLTGLDFSAFASELTTGSCGENVTYSLNTVTGELDISGTGDMYDYDWNKSPFFGVHIIQNVTINSGVTSIGQSLFFQCDNLVQIDIPDTVTRIGDTAFNSCTSLESISVPSSVKTIGSSFRNCSNLNTVVLHEGLLSIGDYCFQNDNNLISINLPDSLTTLGSHVFETCNKLTEIHIPTSISEIPDSAFYNCSSLTTVEIPKNVETISSQAFIYCSGLTDITVYNKNCNIYDDEYTFPENAVIHGYNNSTAQTYAEKYGRSFVELNCAHTYTLASSTAASWTSNGVATYTCTKCGESYTEPVYLTGSCGENVTYTFDADTGILKISGTGDMYNYESSDTNKSPFFDNRDNIKYLIIEEGITGIGSHAFATLFNLESITIPNGVREIGEGAFALCLKISEVSIPSSVISIGNRAFNCGYGLTRITVEEGNLYYSSKNGVLFNKAKTRLLQYPSASPAASYSVPDTVNEICEYAFLVSTNLTEITIPDSVTDIDRYAFLYCDGLESIEFPESVSYIGEGVFNECTSLKSVTIYNKACTITDYGESVLTIPKTAVIRGYGNSTAQEYAKKYGIEFDVLECKEHTWDGGTYELAPTCIAEGLVLYTCTVCNAKRLEIAPMTEHTPVIDSAVLPTCVSNGKTEGSHCAVCGKVLTEQSVIPKISHDFSNNSEYCRYDCGTKNPDYKAPADSSGGSTDSGENSATDGSTTHIHTAGASYVTNVVKATPEKYGTYDLVTPCSVCGAVLESKFAVIEPPEIGLEKSSLVYTGKNNFPTVVTDGAAHSEVYPSASKKVGRYTVKVTLSGELYEGSTELTYDIVPNSGKIKAAKRSGKNASLKWAKVKGVSGYEIQLSKSKTFSKGTRRYTASKKYTSAKLKLGKGKYYVRVRTYQIVKFGGKRIKLYSLWSKAKKVK